MGYSLSSSRTIYELFLLTIIVILIFRRPIVGLSVFLFISAASVSVLNYNPYVFINLHLLRTIAIITLIAVIIKTTKGGSKFSIPAQNWMMFGMFCIMCFSRLVHGLNLNHESIDDVFKLTLMYFLITTTIDSEKKIKYGIWAIIIGLTVEAWAAFHNARVGITRLAIPGWWIDKNYFALSLVMGLPLASTLFLAKGKILKRALLLGIIALLFMTIIRTYSRGGYLGMFVVLSLIFLRLLVKKEWRIASLFFIPVIIFLFVFKVSGTAWDKLNSISDYEEDASAMGRITFWKAGLNMMQKNPIFGVGPGNFGEAMPYYMDVNEYNDTLYQEKLIKTGQKRSPHNMFILIGAENGIPALLLWIWLLFKTFLDGIKVLRPGSKDPAAASLSDLEFALMVGVVGWLICGLFLAAFYDPVSHALIAMIAASRRILINKERTI